MNRISINLKPTFFVMLLFNLITNFYRNPVQNEFSVSQKQGKFIRKMLQKTFGTYFSSIPTSVLGNKSFGYGTEDSEVASGDKNLSLASRIINREPEKMSRIIRAAMRTDPLAKISGA